jgi:anti-sigma factor ChrR (cupin superfamily)
MSNSAASLPTATVVFGDLMRTVSTEGELSWEPLREGIETSRIYATAGGASMAFVRFSPGAVLPRHHHDGYEHIFILRGSQQDDDGEYHAGALLIHPPGSSHRVISRSGCVVLAFWEKPVRLV